MKEFETATLIAPIGEIAIEADSKAAGTQSAGA
jgi:hypothetical protein